MVSTAEIKKPETLNPVIIDFGKRKKKDIKQLRNGTGKLVDEIKDGIGELVTNGSGSSGAQPIILVVSEKRKSGNGLWPIY